MNLLTDLLHSLGTTLWTTRVQPWESRGREMAARQLSTDVHLDSGWPSTGATHPATPADLRRHHFSTAMHPLTTTTRKFSLDTTLGVHQRPRVWMSFSRPLAFQNAQRVRDSCSERHTSWN